MKTIFFTMFFLIVNSTLFAQITSPDVIASAGESFQNTEIQIDWTLGELNVLTFQNNSNIISQGYQQPYLEITSLDKIPAQFGEINIFPNPTSEWVNININLNHNSEIQMMLFQVNGSLIWQDKRQGDQISEKININNYPSGHYILKINSTKNQFSQSFKILKSN